MKNLGMGEWAPPPCLPFQPYPPSRPLGKGTVGYGCHQMRALSVSVCVCLLVRAGAVLAAVRAWWLLWWLSVCARVNDPSVSNINDQRVSKKSPEGGPINLSFSIVCAYAVSCVCLCVVSYCLMTHWLRVSLISRAFWLVYYRH